MFRTIRSLTELGLGAGTAVMLIACSFGSPIGLDTPGDLYEILNTAPYAQPYDSDRWTAFNDERLRVDHGYSCIAADRAASKRVLGVRVMEQAPIPENYDATVFMNGWNADYQSKDHHVMGLGGVIFNVRNIDGQLFWDAGGVLSDRKGDDAYEWCYNYDIVYWPTNSTQFDIRATHSDPSGKLLFVEGEIQDSFAVHTIRGTFTSPNQKVPRAALPAGMAMAYDHGDHHVAQLGFVLGDQSISGKTLSWESTAILKDKARRRRYQSAAAVSILSGRNIKVTKPAQVGVLSNDVYLPQPNGIDLEPRATASCGNVQLGGPLTVVRNYAITGLTSHYAIPMLTGFELSYSCSDQHVKYVGAKLKDWTYQPPVDGQTGTLYYQVETMLTDKDKIPGMNDQVEVSVLGINRLGQG
ncbi:MAG TPA: hypothetical protein VFD92_20190 [Candidatus Binatia bacterium]|nr:hypothetical protein [Candidatus Binatia bacterium]